MKCWIRVYRKATWDAVLQKQIFGDWRWSMKATNGRIIGASTEGYKRVGPCLKNLAKVTGFSWSKWVGKVDNRWVSVALADDRVGR